ncbi:MAG TPA: hypothetical protein VJ346_09150 [Bacteroidales bacterium]|nr:hypothetical protein [Bacteroidales bacterium]
MKDIWPRLQASGMNTVLAADAGAFAQMMKHIKETDSLYQTVIMIQVQNEVGILGSTRDFSDSANEAFNSPVPAELLDYLTKNKETLLPELIKTWEGTGCRAVVLCNRKTQGNRIFSIRI